MNLKTSKQEKKAIQTLAAEFIIKRKLRFTKYKQQISSFLSSSSSYLTIQSIRICNWSLANNVNTDYVTNLIQYQIPTAAQQYPKQKVQFKLGYE